MAFVGAYVASHFAVAWGANFVRWVMIAIIAILAAIMLPALARARRHLDALGRGDVTLIITGGLRTAADFAKALALGANGVAVSNAALQAIGCLGMRACHTNYCPVGIATQQEHLRARLVVRASAERLCTFFRATIELMQVLARACGHDHLGGFSSQDLTTWDREMAHLSGVAYGVGSL